MSQLVHRPRHPERPKPGQRREKKYEQDMLWLRCFGVDFIEGTHNGEWLPAHQFSARSDRAMFSSICKKCNRARQNFRRGLEERISLDEVRKWILEISKRCGSFNAAARTIGVPEPTIYRWLGRYTGFTQKNMTKESAKRVLTTLIGLREGTIEPKKSSKRSGQVYKHGCSGCGGPVNEYDPNCIQCKRRKISKERREAA